LIPVDEIFRGGPGKDSIPAIDDIVFVAAEEIRFLNAKSSIIGISHNELSKAYPINILNGHEIVNDQFNGTPVIIIFCPLCGSGMAFLSTVNSNALTFGVSGILYNSDVLLYDRQTKSLWSQLMTKAIRGSLKGKSLTGIPVRHTTWEDWQAKYPDTLVLTTKTGFDRDYKSSPYVDYITSPQTMFPISSMSRRYHPKEEVLGLEIDGQFKVYPFIELEKSPAEFMDTVKGRMLTVRYDSKLRSVAVFDQQGKQLVSVRTFWFAWYAFHSETDVYVTRYYIAWG